MTQLSISQARGKLTQLASTLRKENEAVEVTSRGKPVLAILPWDLYEALEETIEILDDEDLQKKLKQSIKEVEQGKVLSWDKVREEFLK